MKLSDLDPRWLATGDRAVLVFDCPLSRANWPDKPCHKVCINVHSGPAGVVDGVRYWHAEGFFPNTLTITPSINETHNNPETGAVEFQCWHGFITNGEIK